MLRLFITLGMMLRFETLDVDTSPALVTRLVTAANEADPTVLALVSGLLSALDPFRVWFWLVVIVGLSATAQLRGWRAWAACSVCWLTAAGGRTALAIAVVARSAQAAASA